VNQHRVIERKRRGEDIPFEEFRSVFEKRVKTIGHIVAMMAPWQEPHYLTRIWCVFELFTAQTNDCEVTIMMPSDEKERFVEGLRSGDYEDQMNALFSTLAKTDVTKANASVESDRTEILEIVKKGVGYANFNMAVSGLLKEWAVGVVVAAVEEGRRNMEDDSFKKRQGELLNNVGNLLIDIEGNDDRALSIGREAVILNEEVYDRNSVQTAESLRLVGRGLGRASKYDEALKTHKEALGIFELMHNGRENDNVAKALLPIGWVLSKKGEYEEALKVWRESLSIQEKLFGEESIETTIARSNVSMIFKKKGEVDEFLRLTEMNLEIQINCLGKEHPDTAYTMNNIGFAYYNKGDYEKALEMYKPALLIAEKVYGNDHERTKNRRCAVADTTRLISNNQQ